jgi:hypothetical protein
MHVQYSHGDKEGQYFSEAEFSKFMCTLSKNRPKMALAPSSINLWVKDVIIYSKQNANFKLLTRAV